VDAAPSSGRSELDPALQAKLHRLIAEGTHIWRAFDREVRRKRWHPFVAADYGAVMRALTLLRAPGRRFLEWGSGSGVITIMADLLGFEAYGIELDPELVGVARELAGRHESQARFAAGSFLPEGYVWIPNDGDARPGTIGEGLPAYSAIGHSLEDFQIVFGYPWTGEGLLMRDVMRRHGAPDAQLILYGADAGVQVVSNGPPGAGDIRSGEQIPSP